MTNRKNKPEINLLTWLQSFNWESKSIALSLSDSFSFDTEKVTVALADSGLMWNHPTFKGAKILAKDFSKSLNLKDRTGHGTKNASLLIGQGNGWIKGLIPNTRFLFGKVLGTQGYSKNERNIANAIRWFLKMKADIIVLPFGTTKGSVLISNEIRTALKRGCIVLAAAGNNGPEQLHFPAWLDGVLAVSGLDSNRQVIPYCCAVPEVNIFAPGVEVPTIGLNGHTTTSGSSPATLISAGLIARNLMPHRTHLAVTKSLSNLLVTGIE